MQRMIAIMDYYNSMMNTADDIETEVDLHDEFISFCDEHYEEKWMLEDYMHCVEHHSHEKWMVKKVKKTECKEHRDNGEVECRGIARHYRNLEEKGKGVHPCIELVDSFHFHALHLYDVGLRTNIQVSKNV